MRVLLIDEDGRPEVLEGSFGEELTLIAVLTQAALAALDESAFHARQPKSESVQMMLEKTASLYSACLNLVGYVSSMEMTFQSMNSSNGLCKRSLLKPKSKLHQHTSRH